MKIINHPRCTTTIGAPADMQDGSCEALPVAYNADTHGIWAVSFWMPDAAELAMLNAGGGVNLYVRAVGRQHPVVGLGTYPVDVAPMPASAGMRCTYCCAKAGDLHADGCPELPGGSIEQWHTGQPVPQCPICHDTGTAFGKVCECGK